MSYAFQKDHFLHWNGSVAADLLLMSLQGNESVSMPYCYQLRSLTALKEKEITALHGKAFSCQIGDGLHNRPQRYLHGIVTHIQCSRMSDGNAMCTFTLEPAFALLRMGRSMRVWQNISVPDLVKKLLGEHHINQLDIQLHKTYQKREYCVQYRESDFHFLSRLLEEEGIYYFFKHEENLHTMVLADSSAAHPMAKDCNLLWHHQGENLTPGNIDNWSSCSSLIPGEAAFSGFNSQQAAAVADQYTSKSEHNSLDQVSFTDVTPFEDRTMLASRAKITMEAWEANTLGYEAGINAYWLSCGEVFTLKDHPTDSDSYRIQALSLEASNNVEDGVGDYHCKVKSLRNNVTWHPVATLAPANIAGVLIAQVVGPSSEEIHTDESGRIKIQFPWDKENKNDGTSSCWVRVSQPWTGSQFGGQFIPRIGSEVLVSFIQGNPDFPMVIGSVYNGKNKLPFPLPDEKTESGFASRSTSNGGMDEGHRLSFNDKKGEEKLTISAQKDLLLTVNHDVTSDIKHEVKSKIGANRDTEITKGNDTLVLKQGSLYLTLDKGDLENKVTGNISTSLSNGNYTLTASGGSGKIKTDKACVIESIQSIELKVGSNKISLSPSGITISGTMIKIEGSGTTEIKGAMTTLQGSGMTQIKGGIINIG
ncbi:type VI secretion system Vgr family protein [Rahnella woolbedingensis]|uniref:Type VI secretion system tip protein VgrG n=1 Tax=Rahnella woolbedingensis TaxID=1510574 RepID=A0A419N2Y8_9GAMM|nr:type VI secretion system tip protein TssI/VgrG [Rahnella woolbedingensis]RJT36254.1 type VI secretion system tip protein VgrG [Rahnella woolbedingensis]